MLNPCVRDINDSWNFFANYNHTERERHSLWEDLSNISLHINRPWIVLGDFNTTRFGGANPILSHLADFNQCIDNCRLADLRLIGQDLSWNNSPQSSEVKFRKLDRALVNIEWLCDFPTSFAEYRAPWLSDHTPIIVHIRPYSGNGKKPFKFLNSWLEDSSLFEAVERAWKYQVRGNPMYILIQKLKQVKITIKQWNQNVFGRIDIKAPILRQRLEIAPANFYANPANRTLRDEVAEAKSNYEIIARKEESML
ncbi:uncharacterized protein LOC143859524 [Tasmannia lanceolata]|uniref:uncharacterized protein LOC143859524 n=1 Tax=Tasmannia lanceolata TaxID=3420 RepID=UPI004063F094